MLLANHQNALMDALLIAAYSNKAPYFLTRSDVFNNRVLKVFFNLLRMLPIYRLRDGRDSLGRNQEVFDKCARLLNSNATVLLFPEANHNIKRMVRPLSKGFTRILFNTLRKYPGLDILLVPVGVNYKNAAGFPDSAAFYFGRPLHLNQLYSSADLRIASMEVREKISLAIKHLTTHIGEELPYDKVIMELDQLQADYLAPDRCNALIKEFSYKRSVIKYPVKENWLYHIWDTAFQLFNFPLLLIWRLQVKNKIPEVEFVSTYRFLFSLIFYPLTPDINQELTAEIGTYHADALNKIGSLYYSEENYDDYYYGKGSTFPDVNGSIGILFEQGSSRGHIQESENGTLTFPFTIRNQFTTALSTIAAAKNMRTKILNYQRDFFRNARNEAARNRTKAIVFGDSKDAAKSWHLAEILKRHKIKIHELAANTTLGGKSYTQGHSYVIPMDQKNHRLIKAMFEKRTTFTDSLFYDISAWTFPLAFNVDYSETSSMSNAGPEISELRPLQGHVDQKSNYAYLFEWNEYYSPRALNKIVNQGLRAKVAKSRFSLDGVPYDYGTIMIPVQNQELDTEELYAFLEEIAKESNLHIRGVATGLTKGIDLGSNDFDPVKKQKVAILVGKGVRSYDAGEIWHLFDTRYHMKITKIDTDYFGNADISEYTDIILPSTSGSSGLDKKSANKLRQWVKEGGTLIGYRAIANWFEKNEFMKLKFKKDTLLARDISFEALGDFRGAQVTGGAIFEARQDRSHPINFGYKNDRISLFRNTNIYIEPDKNSYNNPIQYTEDPLQSGYISEENLAMLKNSVPFRVSRMGKGRVILFTDNTNFRAFWYGTNKLLMNAIFFGQMM